MPDLRRHRGPHPEDAELFHESCWPALRQAAVELNWLLDRGYAQPSALKLVGDRHLLAARQRVAVGRCACTADQQQRRRTHQIPLATLIAQPLWIDGYNVLVSLESALSGAVLLRGRDGCLRDMASMHGSYRKVAETIPAANLLGTLLAQYNVGPCRWLLDQPVSNSGRLRALLTAIAEEYGWDWQVDLVTDPDPLLIETECCVATADSVILDGCRCWVNLVDEVVRNGLNRAWIVDLSVE